MLVLVSIITPCYNAEKYLSQTVESVLSQTWQDWELLIIDDCSSDNSMNIIRDYSRRDARVRYFKTEEPSGSPTLPRNIGIENARGRYIAFLDSDDLWLPTKLEEQVNYLNLKAEAEKLKGQIARKQRELTEYVFSDRNSVPEVPNGKLHLGEADDILDL